jgi:hypothetical protein
MMNADDLKLQLIYKATRNGFLLENFNNKCYNMGQTISVMKSEYGKTFGGYTNLSLNKKGWISGTGKSFIFQLDYNTKHNCINNEMEIYGGKRFTILFGDDDIAIDGNSNEN